MTQSYDQPETFRPRSDVRRTTLTSGLVLFIPLAALTWFIVASILAALDVPVPWLLGLVLGGAIMAALHTARSRKLDAVIAGMTLTFDAEGITESNPIATRFVSWDGLRGARMVKPIVGLSTGKMGRAGMRSRTPGVDALGSAAATRELGLVGIGSITVAPSASLMQRTTYEQNETLNGVDPDTGMPLVALFLQQFDRAWPDRRIGEWVRHHRPDVHAEAKAISDQQAHDTSLNVRAMWREAKDGARARAEAEDRMP